VPADQTAASALVACRVGCRHRERRIDFDVKVDEILKARFSSERFVDPLNSTASQTRADLRLTTNIGHQRRRMGL